MKQNYISMGTGLEEHGITNANVIYWTPPTPVLYEQIIENREGMITHLGPIAVKTGHYTGRSPNDKFIVDEPGSHDRIWWGRVNRPFDPARFDALHNRLLKFLSGRDLYVQDCFVGARPEHRMPLRFITEKAWHSLLVRNLFIRASREDREVHKPEFTVIDVPGFTAIPSLDGTNSEAFILVNLARKLILIGGTSYGGELKKSIFTIMNYLLPLEKNILPMHCSANVGKSGDVAIFFGLSGTGKTTLSADPNRSLIGDDEHGWDDDGVFNFEGGCYAKLIRLSRESEPEIHECTRRFGTILENVAFDTITRRIDLDDDSLTENTRGCYPLNYIPNTVKSGTAGHPGNVVMLTCDAFGVLPPISRLTHAQAIYHFLSGYTAKVAGTESGMGHEPQATFSTCFGAPFMALHPNVYSEMLKDRIARHKVTCWLVNTGWSGGAYGVGSRIRIKYSRAMINAALNGVLNDVPFETEPFFGLSIPTSCPGVPEELLNPRNPWSDRDGYDRTARSLAGRFRDNFSQFRGYVSGEIASVL